MYIQDRHQEQQHADENKEDKDTKKQRIQWSRKEIFTDT